MTESTIVKQEMFDEDVMKALLIDPRFSKKDLAKLSNYNKHRITGSTVNVLYKFGKGCEERKLGRLFPDGGIGLQSYRSDIRSPLSQKWYWDTDVENAHYVIALEFCRKYNLKHDKILQYVDNRDDCLTLVSSSRKKAKTEFLKVLYGGDITLYIDFFQEVEGGITSAGFEFLHEIEAEVSNLMTVVWDKNPDLHKLKTGKENKIICKKPNPKASLMSLLFQTEERLILLLWDKFLQDNNRCLSVLIHDGGFVKKIEGETCFPNELLIEGSKYIQKHLNYDVKLTQKQIEHNWTPYNVDEFVLERPFETVAKEFEDNHLKIVNKGYFIKQVNNAYEIKTESKMKTSYAHMFYNEECHGKDGKIAIVKKPFITKWLSCEHDIRRKEDVGIYPNPTLCPSNIFNLWTPFAMETNNTDFVENKEGLDFILNHLRILCGNQEDVYDYFVKWNAQMIQYPEVKTIMPTLISAEGSGKGTYIELMQKIMGEEKIFETTSPSRDVWGDFNSVMMASFFVVLNELSKKETMESDGKIKGLITDNNLTINPKGIDQFKIKSYHRFLSSTNKEEPVSTCTGDRRNLIIRCSDEKKGDTAYFDQLREYLNDDNVLRTFYKFLKEMPGMDKFHKIPIPETDYQNLLKEKNIPIHLQWLESFTRLHQKEKEVALLGCDIYQDLKRWTDENGIEYNTNSIKLGMQLTMSKIDGIEKGQHLRKGKLTVFNIVKLCQHFKIGCLIDAIE